MNYEKEQEFLQQLYDECGIDSEVEIEADDDYDSLEEDNLEERDHNTDSEQDIDEEPEENIRTEVFVAKRKVRVPHFIGRDGKEKWRKHFTANRGVRIRAENIVKCLPGVKAIAHYKTSPIEIWSGFFTDDMLEEIVRNTNIYIEMTANDPNNRNARKTDL